MFSRNPNEFLRYPFRYRRQIHHTTLETKIQSRQWVSSGKRAPKKVVDYLQDDKTITGEYYSELLDRFDIDFKQKRSHLAKKKVLFHQDNARVHTRVVTKAKLHNWAMNCYDLKKWLGGKRFGSNEETITETNAYFEGPEKTYEK